MDIRALGAGLGAFLALSFLACLVLGFVVPDAGMHTPWLQFIPKFDWSVKGIVLGLVWTQFYAWWTAIVFGSTYNLFKSRLGR